MPKNRKEDFLVLELWQKEKATVGTNAKRSFFFCRQSWSQKARFSFG